MNGFLSGYARQRHGTSCLHFICTCPVSEDCPACRPAAIGPLCETHRNRANTHVPAHKCGDDETCEQCCEHGDTDDYTCLDCGKELTEGRMAAAHDRAKDARKYGDV